MTRCVPGATPGRRCKAVLQALGEGRQGSRAPELITVLAGEDAAARPGRRCEGLVDGKIELELRHGGQPAYWWLLAAE